MHSASTNNTGTHLHYLAAGAATNAAAGTSKNLSDTQQIAYSANTTSWSESYNLIGTSTGATIGRSSSTGSHSHDVTVSNTGDDSAHNNIPPYISAYVWRRIA